MAQLTATEIIFGDSTTLSSKYGIVGAGTTMLFFQAAAPTGWTKSTANTDATLRVVSGTGGVSDGSVNFSTVFPTSPKTITGIGTITATGPAGPNRTHPHLLTAPQLPIHSHTTPGSTGTDGSHSHSYSSHASAPDLSGFSAPSGRDRTNPATVPLDTNDIAEHNHPVSIASQGGNGAHSHSWTFVSAPLSTSLDLRVLYCDLLVCSLN